MISSPSATRQFQPRYGGVTLSVALPVVGLLALAAWPCRAHHSENNLGDAELVRRAGFVVHGTVSAVECRWNADRTQIYTFVEIAVTRNIKGDLGNTVRLRLLGGTADGVTMLVLGQARFAVGEELIVFLQPNPEVLFPVVSFEQGKLSVTADAAGRKRVGDRAAGLNDYLGRLDRLVQIERSKIAVAPPAEVQP